MSATDPTPAEHGDDWSGSLPGEEPSCRCGYNGTPDECAASRRPAVPDTGDAATCSCAAGRGVRDCPRHRDDPTRNPAVPDTGDVEARDAAMAAMVYGVRREFIVEALSSAATTADGRLGAKRAGALLAAHDAEVRRETAERVLLDFADTRGVNVGDEDGDWWRGYRQAQRECVHDAVAAARIAREDGAR